MAGSTLGTLFKITTWGESHGKGVGVVIDGCPAGLSLCEADIQKFLDRRKPGQSRYATPRKEDDAVEILSGVFEGKTTAAAVPRKSAITALTADASTPMRMLVESPASVRDSISRPIQSVPNRYLRHGGRFLREKSVPTARSSRQIPATATAAKSSTAARRKRRIHWRPLRLPAVWAAIVI